MSFQGSAHHPSYVHPPAHTAHSPYHILVLLTRCSKGIHTKAIEECIFPNLMPHMMDCMNLWKQRVKVPTSRGEHFRGKACVNLQKGHALCVDKKALIPVQKQWCTIEKGQCGIQSPCCLFAAMQGPPLLNMKIRQKHNKPLHQCSGQGSFGPIASCPCGIIVRNQVGCNL